jgi:hypothetical protein
MSELTELQEELKVQEGIVATKDAVERLLNNADFKKIILEGYIKDEMHRHMTLAICDKLSVEDRELNNSLAKSAAALSNYLETLVQMGRIAEEDVAQLGEQIEEVMTHKEEE